MTPVEVIDFLGSFKPETTVKQILELIGNEDIDLTEFLNKENYERISR
jgi:hypothetical protein